VEKLDACAFRENGSGCPLEFACSFDSVQMKSSSHTAAAATTYDH
jgi:hypothetical protein